MAVVVEIAVVEILELAEAAVAEQGWSMGAAVVVVARECAVDR